MVDRVVLTRWVGNPYERGVPPLNWTWDSMGEVIISCINGHLAGLQHKIDKEGNITPSILCYGYEDGIEGCGWHVYARLENWDGGEGVMDER